MSAAQTLLVPFSWLYIGFIALVIIVPFVRGKADLLTGKNVFLLGVMNYIGIAGLYSGYMPDFFRVLDYDRSDYENFVVGAIVFLGSLLLAYAFSRPSRKLAGRTLRKWPPTSAAVLYFMLVFALVFSVLGFLPIPIPGVAQLMFQIGNKTSVLAVALAFLAWYQSRRNPVLIATLLGVICFAILINIISGGGRRNLVGILIAMPMCWYWISLRYKHWFVNTALIGVAAMAGFVFIFAYSQVRHFDRRGERSERTIAAAAEAVGNMSNASMSSKTLGTMLGQNAGQTSLAAIHLYTNELEPEPFHALYFVAVNWFPRSYWENKPWGLGFTLPKSARAKGTRATWGPGVIGHGFHEGGLHMLVFYGVLVGACLRYLDELLVRQPTNAYLLACFAAMSGHMFGWTRGDIGTFSIQIIACILAVLTVGFAGRMVFGTGVVYPRTDGPEYVNTNLFALRHASSA